MSKYDGEPIPTTALEAVIRQRDEAQRQEKFLRFKVGQLEARQARRRLELVEQPVTEICAAPRLYQVYERFYGFGIEYYAIATKYGVNDPVPKEEAVERLARFREERRIMELGVQRGTESFDLMMRQWEEGTER